MIKESLVNMADLLDSQRPEREPPSLSGTTARHLYLQKLERVQQVEDGQAIDWQWLRGSIDVFGPGRATFQEWESIGVKERAPIGRQPHRLMLHPTMHGTEGGKET